MYLSATQVKEFTELLHAFFRLPYSTDLDGKDAETLIKIVKGSTDPVSKKKELFDIKDGSIGYSVKTLKKAPSSSRVDLQEQRLGNVEEIRNLRNQNQDNGAAQGQILLQYMLDRIRKEMADKKLSQARSLILLKHWNKLQTDFSFRYWEEDFLHYVENLYSRNEAGEIDWVILPGGLHGRDKLNQDGKGKNIRLLRMHYKHNQIFTDHDIPKTTTNMEFSLNRIQWAELLPLIREYDSQLQADITRPAPAPLVVPAAVVLPTVLFKLGTAELLPEALPALNRLAEALKARPALKLRVAGHTDKLGEPEKNLALSEQRAEAVKAYLVQTGVSAERLSSVGYGDAQPLYPSPDARNRRVEVAEVN